MNATVLLRLASIVGDMHALVAVHGEQAVHKAIAGYAVALDRSNACGRMLQELGIRLECLAEDAQKAEATK